MKLRIRGDSVRLRLRQPEVTALLDQGFVSETTAFAPGVELQYRLETGGQQTRAIFDCHQLRIILPHQQANAWADTDQVGITAEQPAGDGRILRILIEKDFACKDGEGDESQEGAFENPNVASASRRCS